MVDIRKPPEKTGFEDKLLRTVIENWLYTTDMDLRVDAAVELRKRLMKTYPKPAWAILIGNKNV
jgi:hypothetical protein